MCTEHAHRNLLIYHIQLAASISIYIYISFAFNQPIHEEQQRGLKLCPFGGSCAKPGEHSISLFAIDHRVIQWLPFQWRNKLGKDIYEYHAPQRNPNGISEV